MPEKGLPELERVLERMASRANLDFRPEQIAAYAKHIYDGGQPMEGDPGTDPMQWAALAAIEDWRNDPYSESGAWIPSEVFGHQIRGEDLGPNQEGLNALRNEQWGTWAGPGWSQQDLDQLGRPRQPFELSPGDALNHQWMRDRQYLQDILTRKTDNMEGLSVPERQSIEHWTGASQETPESIEQRNIDDALYWYRKGALATHYTGNGSPGITPGYDWATANFKEYGTDEGMGAAMNNNDYALGYLNNNVFAPLEEAMNSQTMRNLDDSEGFTPVVTPVYDFFRNALIADGKPAAHDVALDRQTAKQVYTGSPIVPHSKPNPTREERISAIRQAREALGKTENMSGDDYYYARTGQNPSYLGKFGMTLGSSMVGDPSVFLSGLAGGLKSPQNFWKAFRGEVAQEGAETAGFNGMSAMFPLGQDKDGTELHTPHISTWGNPYAERTDLPKEDDQERNERIKRQENDRVSGAYRLEDLNRALPKERAGYNARRSNGYPEY